MKKIWSLDIPIFQGGMGIGVSLGNLAGAVAAEGGAGTISAAQIGFGEEDFEKNPLKANLRAIAKEVKKARALAKNRGAIGVNIMTVTKHYGEYVKEAVRQKVDFIVSGAGLPMDLPSLAKGSDVKLIPIVSSMRAASLICRRWLKKENKIPDAIIIEGPKAGGHLGFSMEMAKSGDYEEYKEEVKHIIDYIRAFGKDHDTYIPVITAGGYDSAEDLTKQLALGADGIQMATTFVTTEECDAHPAFKDAYIKCKKEDISIVKSPVGMPGRAIKNEFIQRTMEERIPPQKCYGCISVCKPAETPYCITRALINSVTGNLDEGLIFCGTNAWKEDRIKTVHEVVQKVMSGC